MLIKKFDDLPESFKNQEVKYYYDIIASKKVTYFFKRVVDYLIAIILLIILLPVLLVLSVLVKATSKGPIFYRQVRVGKYGKSFRIIKFRTMIVNADKIGAQITVGKRDPRITSIGVFLRKCRLDELPQLFNVILGDMSFVGTRPEVEEYVKEYQNDMLATLLLQPGITGPASIEFKDESEMLDGEASPEQCYVCEILPLKMKINLNYIEKMSLFLDLKIICKTVLEVLK